MGFLSANLKSMKVVTIFFMLIFSLFADDSPVQMTLKKKSDSNYSLQISVPRGFAIQKDAKNKLKLSSEGNLKVEDYASEFNGPVLLASPEYFEKVNEFPIRMKGSGTLLIDSKIFYCNLERGICYPAKISRKEEIK